MKLKRGQKLCQNCNQINGARAHTCKHCGSPFVSKSEAKGGKVKKKKKLKKFVEIEDWKSLSHGDRIKVIGRSGNYYIGENGERQYMTDAGVYIVKSQDDKGLIVYGSEGGFGYIYMGPEKKSDMIPNMYRSPHKIVRVNNPITV